MTEMDFFFCTHTHAHTHNNHVIFSIKVLERSPSPPLASSTRFQHSFSLRPGPDIKKKMSRHIVYL